MNVALWGSACFIIKYDLSKTELPSQYKKVFKLDGDILQDHARGRMMAKGTRGRAEVMTNTTRLMDGRRVREERGRNRKQRVFCF